MLHPILSATQLGWLFVPMVVMEDLFSLVIGFVVLVSFGIYEKRVAEAVVPCRFFKSRMTVAVMVGAFFHGMVFYLLTLCMPLFFQAVNLESSISSAVTMLPTACVLIAFSIISSIVIQYLRRYIWLL